VGWAIMNILKIVGLAALAGLLLPGCATMYEQECNTADWEAVGYADGYTAKPIEHGETYADACAAHDVTPDMQAYEQGYDKGIRTYCTPDLAYNMGKSGSPVPEVCPADMATDLKAFNKEGLKNQGLPVSRRWSKSSWAIACLPMGSAC
jgi:hypothetical protein